MWVVSFALMTTLAQAPGRGTADERTRHEEAEALIREANRHRRSGDDTRALGLLEKAYRTYPSPRTAAQLGLGERANGRFVDAETHLAEGLRGEGDPFIEKNRAKLVQTLEETKRYIGSIDGG